MAIIGIDLGGTKIAAALFDETGEMHCRSVRLLDGATGAAVADLAIEMVNDIRRTNVGIGVSGIGICVPGIARSAQGSVWAPNIPGWENFPLASYMQEALGTETPILVESDRTCYILGEVWKGAARGCRNAIYIAVGTGIGAGILLDGRIVHGSADIAGAIGWMALQPPYLDEYIPVGCFEYYASGNGIGTQARKALQMAPAYHGVLAEKPVEEVTSHDVFAAAAAGDPIATKVLDKAITMWGMAAANLVSIFNPERVVFGGGVFGPARRYMDRIYSEACRWGQPISMQQVKFLPSEIDGDAALLGAAYLTLQNQTLK